MCLSSRSHVVSVYIQRDIHIKTQTRRTQFYSQWHADDLFETVEKQNFLRANWITLLSEFYLLVSQLHAIKLSILPKCHAFFKLPECLTSSTGRFHDGSCISPSQLAFLLLGYREFASLRYHLKYPTDLIIHWTSMFNDIYVPAFVCCWYCYFSCNY